MSVHLWLDDLRPAPAGWTHAKTVAEAQALLEHEDVDMASLDHDLGACDQCMGGRSVGEWMAEWAYQSMPHCDHAGTGYTLVCWMRDTGLKPRQKPFVHSANPDGARRMRQALDELYR